MKVTTVGTLSGFQEFFLQPIIKDRPNDQNTHFQQQQQQQQEQKNATRLQAATEGIRVRYPNAGLYFPNRMHKRSFVTFNISD